MVFFFLHATHEPEYSSFPRARLVVKRVACLRPQTRNDGLGCLVVHGHWLYLGFAIAGIVQLVWRNNELFLRLFLLSRSSSLDKMTQLINSFSFIPHVIIDGRLRCSLHKASIEMATRRRCRYVTVRLPLALHLNFLCRCMFVGMVELIVRSKVVYFKFTGDFYDQKLLRSGPTE